MSIAPYFSHKYFNDTRNIFKDAMKTAIARLQISNPSLSLSFSAIDNKDDDKKWDNYTITIEEEIEGNKKSPR